MGDSEDLDQLWAARSSSSGPRNDCGDEAAAIVRVHASDQRASTGLVDRHLIAAWQLAIAVSLDAGCAPDALEIAWTRTVTAPARAGTAFRRRLLHEVRRTAGELSGGLLSSHDLDDLDLTAHDGAPPFGDDADPTMTVAAFTLRPEPQRAAWWLVRVEQVPTREVPSLLDLPALTGLTLALDAVDTLRSATIEAQHRTAEGDCHRAVPRFGPYLDDALSPLDVSVLHRHLEGCATCTERLDALEDPVGLLVERMAPPPPTLRRRLVELLVPTEALPPGVSAGHRGSFED
jgi:DNA-directed RNA polymerase specialized sigma24 family protein